MDKPVIRTARALCVGFMLSAALPAAAEGGTKDPYEGFNRAMFKFNDKADRYVLKPVARGYQKITPKPVRGAVSNFFNNLRDVNSFASNLLRGNVKNAGYDFMRVAVNSTFGLGGLINIADAAGMQNNKNTLGDTFASWGWKNSNYLVVPLAGPSTVRDTLGSAVTTVYSVERGLIPNPYVRYPLTGLNVVNRREGMLELTDTLDQMALDKYIVTRDAYLALRNKQLGNPLPEQDELPDPEGEGGEAVQEAVPQDEAAQAAAASAAQIEDVSGSLNNSAASVPAVAADAASAPAAAAPAGQTAETFVETTEAFEAQSASAPSIR